MKFVKQGLIILAVTLAGEVCHMLIPLPISASVYGIVLMFLCLELKLIKVSAVKETAMFLVEIMPIMFVPAAVGLMDSWSVMRSSWVAYVVITVVVTVAVMGASGAATQGIIRAKRHRGGGDNE